MAGETHNPKGQNDDKPQVFAESKNLGGKWKFNRRDFVKAASVAGTLGALNGCSNEASKTPDPTMTPSATIRPGLDVTAPEMARSIKSHAQDVQKVIISSDGNMLVSAGEEGTTKLWSLPAGALMREFDDSYVTSLALSPDGTILAVGYKGGIIKL